MALWATVLALAASAGASARAEPQLRVPASAEQLLVVSSPTADPPGDVASLRAYSRSGPGTSWRPTLGPWPAETGIGHLLPAAVRREGDGATPIGVFGIGSTIYGNKPNPGGLHTGYHRLTCGDWWDEDPYSSRYNEFVEVPMRSDARIRELVGGALDGDRRLPVPGRDPLQREPYDQRLARAGIRDLSAQLDRCPDARVRRPARVRAAGRAAVAPAGEAPGYRDRYFRRAAVEAPLSTPSGVNYRTDW